MFRGGNLKNVNINVKFNLFEEFAVDEISGSLLFSNTRFEYNDEIFKKLFSTVSGDIAFKLKPQKIGEFILGSQIKKGSNISNV